MMQEGHKEGEHWSEITACLWGLGCDGDIVFFDRSHLITVLNLVTSDPDPSSLCMRRPDPSARQSGAAFLINPSLTVYRSAVETPRKTAETTQALSLSQLPKERWRDTDREAEREKEKGSERERWEIGVSLPSMHSHHPAETVNQSPGTL